MEPILHLSIPVSDLAAARTFYVEALGCEPGRTRDDWIDVWFFGLQLTLQHRPQEVLPADQAGCRHLGVALGHRAGFDALVERLRRHDVTWLQEPVAHHGAELSGKVGAKVADPSGNVIELKCYDDVTALRPGPT